MFNLIEQSDNSSKKSRTLWWLHRDKLAVNDNDNIVPFCTANFLNSFN